jgi:cytochrome c oxidase subunit 2
VRRHPLAQMFTIGAVASVVGVAVALIIDWFPTSASSQAPPIDTLYDVLLIVSIPVFVLVEVVVLFSVWKFRMRPGEELKDGPPIHGNTRVEIIWTAIPAILMIGLSGYAYGVLRHIEKDKPNAMNVQVTGQQFTWTFQYPQAGGKMVSSSQLYLPKGKPVYFNIKARDVIHSFWVPAFRLKSDAVPGITTHVRVTPNRLGTYPVVCAELCGLGHSAMRQTAHVLTPAAFQAWLSRQRQGAGAAAGGAAAGGSASAGGGGGASGAAAGKQVFASAACGTCHTLSDAGASGTVGPNLDQALKGKPPAFIRESIVKPNAEIAKGFPSNVMPQDFGSRLSAQQLNALVAYLAQVTK